MATASSARIRRLIHIAKALLLAHRWRTRILHRRGESIHGKYQWIAGTGPEGGYASGLAYSAHYRVDRPGAFVRFVIGLKTIKGRAAFACCRPQLFKIKLKRSVRCIVGRRCRMLQRQSRPTGITDTRRLVFWRRTIIFEYERSAAIPEILVGAAGFEPTTPCPPDKCANRAAPRPDRERRGL
jgi:hypothetical protein